ncbi:MAG: glycosyl transferase family 1, partial [Casimicrobiaceae bacterium]
MKILYLCHRFPFPPKRGGKIRPFNMIRHLSERHEVHVVSLVHSALEAREGEGIAPHCAKFSIATVSDPLQWVRMVARIPTPVPSSFGY